MAPVVPHNCRCGSAYGSHGRLAGTMMKRLSRITLCAATCVVVLTAAPAAATAATLGLSLTASTVTYGNSLSASGRLAPAAAGTVYLERQSGTTWTRIGTDGLTSGSWAIRVTPDEPMTIRARMSDGSAVSRSVTVGVRPRLIVTTPRATRPFVGSTLRVQVRPAQWSGRARISVSYAGRVRETVTARVRSGLLRTSIPSPGVGRLPVRISLPAASGGWGAATGSTSVRARARHLSSRSRGPEVVALLRRLRELNFHTPRGARRYDARVADAVLAFHKSQRMGRRRDVTVTTWKRLARARPMEPRHSGPYNHVEVDKSRQILMVVRDGEVLGTIHVSTGATGNTPVGRWRIYQRGGSHLYKFMAFRGNFGIHGYVPVPAWPASHGCVREPMWAAGWTWANTDIGDTVYVYR